MLKREMKVNFKSFIIWTLIIVCTFIIAFSIYPSIVKNNASFDELLSTMPKEMLAMFNMDVVNINTVTGWLATEGYMMLTLLGGCYAAILGSTIVLKEEDEKTIEFLYAKPITRNKILSNKILISLFYLTLFNVVISITTFIGCNLSNDFYFIKWLLLSLCPILIHYIFFFTSLLISMFFSKTRKSMMISLGTVFIAYVLSVLGAMSNKIEFLKYISPFEYINSRQIMIDERVNVIYLLVSFGIIIISLISSYHLYNKKEFNI